MVHLVFSHQPYATMSSFGLLPVVRLKWRPKRFPCVAYVYAIEESESDADNPIEWWQEYINQKKFGNIPNRSWLPVNALIGKVEITGETDVPGLYYITNAHQFVAPLDVPIEDLPQWEKHLGRLYSTVFIPDVPSLSDEESMLSLPLDVFDFEVSKFDGKICLELAGSLAKLVLDENGMLKPFTKFKLWKDTVSVRGYGFFKNLGGSVFIDEFTSNHYMWQNEFNDEQRFRVGGEIDVPFSGTNINVGYETLKNHVYFDENALPAQYTPAIHVLSATVSQNFRFGPLGWDNKFTFQTSSNENVLSLPKFSIYSNLYFTFRVAKVLHVQIGVDCNYYTKYYAPKYNPATMVFYNQREIKCGNFALLNAYANFKLKKARFFVMYQHFNKGLFGGMNYFSLPHYPLNPGRFQLGVSVDFVN